MSVPFLPFMVWMDVQDLPACISMNLGGIMLFAYISAWLRATNTRVTWYNVEEVEDRLDRGWAIDAWLRTNGGIDAWIVWCGDMRVIGCQINPLFDVDDQVRDLAMKQIAEMDAFDDMQYVLSADPPQIDLPEEYFADERMDGVYPTV